MQEMYTHHSQGQFSHGKKWPTISLSFCSALDTGTLRDNGIEDGTEVRLVPAIESGVTVSLSL